MKREQRLLEHEAALLERLHKRLGLLLEQKLVASPADVAGALGILQYQALILEKLNQCRPQNSYRPAEFDAYLSGLDDILSERDIDWP